MKVTKKLWSTAYHEAGHAAMVLRLGGNVKKITIQPDGESLGSVTYSKLLNLSAGLDTSTRTRLRMEKLVMVGFAGECAARKFNPKGFRRRISDRDWHNILFVMDLFYAGGNQKLMEAYLNFLYLWTQAHLDELCVWHGVQRLAEALIEHRTLRGEKARQVYQKAALDAVEIAHRELLDSNQ